MGPDMIHAITFGLLQILATVYAFARGQWPERLAAVAMIAALVAGWCIPYERGQSYQHLELARLATDVALFAAFYVIGLWAHRFWPLWMSALQLLNVEVHGISLFGRDFLPMAYHHLIEWISYLMLAILIIGTRRHDRRTRPRGPTIG